MKSIGLTDFLSRIGYTPDSVGNFIKIGDKTAIRNRKGVNYRKNYERGVLITVLAKRYELQDFLEFGTGRGYVCACLADMADMNRIATIDKKSIPEARALIQSLGIDESRMEYIQSEANTLSPSKIQGDFDLVFIDAQHDGKSVKLNYDYVVPKLKPKHIIVFDDYRNKFKSVKTMIDSIAYDHKVLVHTDGWLVKNKMIKHAKDADIVKGGKEFGSGMVVCSTMKLV